MLESLSEKSHCKGCLHRTWLKPSELVCLNEALFAERLLVDRDNVFDCLKQKERIRSLSRSHERRNHSAMTLLSDITLILRWLIMRTRNFYDLFKMRKCPFSSPVGGPNLEIWKESHRVKLNFNEHDCELKGFEFLWTFLWWRGSESEQHSSPSYKISAY